MQNRTLKNLEYNKILKLLSANCVTYIGKEIAENLLPVSNIETAQKLQTETKEACSFTLRKNNVPLSPITNLANIINKLNVGGVLNIEELLTVATTLKISREIKEYYQNDDIDDIEILTTYFEAIYTNKNLENEIFRCIKTDTELDDYASPELHKIRKQIHDAENKIKDKLNSLIHSSSTSKYLQDAVVTFRNGRYVIPVKQEYKNEINGLVHDSSASGSTIFIEPTSIFNINNEIKELQLKEKNEIERILSLLSQMVMPITNELHENINQIGKIDFAFAKAKLAFDMEAFMPKLNDKGYINLKKARPPLLNSKTVVPIDVWLGEKFNCLVITGPNTGGKTVTLKTVGLLTLMAESGLHLPASESSEISVFDNVYTDIGDEQSIEQSLSTFSAHMTNIVNITNNITKKDLVLIDELGSGTDPVEGSALARAILSYLHDFDCRTIATTHYSELKTFAMQKNGMENACCEFDFEKLTPTYKLLIGVPGRSNAFLISKKLGLSDKILGDASTYISEETVKFEDILTNIEKDKKAIKEQKELSDKMLYEAQNIKETAQKKHEEIMQKKASILSKAKIEARDILINAEEEANQIIKDLIEIKATSTKDQYKKAEENRQKIKKSISEIQKDLLSPKIKSSLSALNPNEILKRMEVYVPTIEQNVTVVSLPDKNGNLVVQSGLMKLTMHISNLEKPKQKPCSQKATGRNNTNIKKSQNISTEINLLGKTVDEAITILEKYIDDAYLSGLHEIRIVHGKGTGLLRKGVQTYLKSNPHIKEFRLGVYGEGDTGVTIATLK